MKKLLPFLFILSVYGCSKSSSNTPDDPYAFLPQQVRHTIDSLGIKIKDTEGLEVAQYVAQDENYRYVKGIKNKSPWMGIFANSGESLLEKSFEDEVSIDYGYGQKLNSDVSAMFIYSNFRNKFVYYVNFLNSTNYSALVQYTGTFDKNTKTETGTFKPLRLIDDDEIIINSIQWFNGSIINLYQKVSYSPVPNHKAELLNSNGDVIKRIAIDQEFPVSDLSKATPTSDLIFLYPTGNLLQSFSLESKKPRWATKLIEVEEGVIVNSKVISVNNGTAIVEITTTAKDGTKQSKQISVDVASGTIV